MRKHGLPSRRSTFLSLALSLLVPSLGGAAGIAEKESSVGIAGAAAIGEGALRAVGVNEISAVHAAAVAESLPAGSARESMVSFTDAVADKVGAESRMARIFDAARNRAAATGATATAGELLAEDVPSEAAALHKEYETAAAARLKLFREELKKLVSGRYGISLEWELTGDGLQYASAYTVDGRAMTESRINEKVKSGELPKDEWETARRHLDAALPGQLEKLIAVVRENDKAHRAVHRKMDAIAKKIALRDARTSLAKGRELQAWGIPVSISIDRDTSLRYVRLYRLSGIPTDLGDALHDLLAPLVAADPHFLSHVTGAQLHEAVQFLGESLKYTLDPNTPDGRKRMRFSGVSEGYDYPEVRKSLVDFARKKLLETPLPEDKPAGLGPVSPERQPSPVLAQVLHDAMIDYRSKIESGKSTSAVMPLLRSLHAALGMPVQSSQGPMLLSLRHRQLLPLLEELRRRNAHDDVVSAVIRSFPLGESILRLGVHRLWAKGLTGKGVKIAVIDNGVDFDHPDFSDIVNPVHENMTRDRGPHTKGEHGTPMASIIHAIAPDAEIQSYQALANTEGLPGVSLSGEEIDAAIIKAMDRARANGAQIINMSLGSPMGYANDAIAKKVTELAKAGIVVVVSAGNSGYDLPDGYQVGSPATSPDAIAVGAVNYHGEVQGNREAFGSQGIVFNTETHAITEKPEIWAYGVNVKAAAQMPAPLYADEPVPYQNGSGTSPAVPHAVGVTALMLQAAEEAGRAVAGFSTTAMVRQSLVAAAAHINRRPVLDDASKAVDAYLAATALKLK